MPVVKDKSTAYLVREHTSDHSTNRIDTITGKGYLTCFVEDSDGNNKSAKHDYSATGSINITYTGNAWQDIYCLTISTSTTTFNSKDTSGLWTAN